MRDDTGYLRLVEQIRFFLAGTDRRRSDDFARAAAAYAALCREANVRLRRCIDYLQLGLRSEAVHLADCVPSLTEFLPALNGSQFEQWSSACVEAGLPPPPRLDISGVQDLAVARELERQVESLASRHRSLAVTGAPLLERLHVTRALFERDPDNPCWPQCVRELEIARLGELHDALKRAIGAGDADAIEVIASELSAEAWQAPIPERLRADLQTALTKQRLEAASQTARELLLQILAAYRDRNYYECAALMSSWKSFLETERLELSPEFQSQIRQVNEWLSAEAHSHEVSRQLEAIQPILSAERKRMDRKRAARRLARIGLVMGALSVVAVAAFLLIRSLA